MCIGYGVDVHQSNYAKVETTQADVELYLGTTTSQVIVVKNFQGHVIYLSLKVFPSRDRVHIGILYSIIQLEGKYREHRGVICFFRIFQFWAPHGRYL